ncbi:MAG: ABC transporter ATP-binding protein [Thaumarchaeota archaeon]|jgi:oligopeptide/dipeptide ABC transporter ATP-binding protein|nr:ABC transporter ATP-binding protein [Candidatus Geocrenenecus arthurdayi]MCL7391276.1 ABC transporter ATP-binding protein [Candidatus Geocrenenecus arthurdayi]
MNDSILEIHELSVRYQSPAGPVRAVDDVSLSVRKGEVLGLVGESGSGKSTLGLAILRLVPPPGRIVGGSILYNGLDLLKLSDEMLQKIRGREISMVFQDPSSSLNPLMKIKDHFIELFKSHDPSSLKKDIEERSIEILRRLGIPPERFNDYPHQLSGGMKQRVYIGLAIALNPKVLIADEPTTALDVLIEAQILNLLNKLKRELNLTVILITHNMGVVAENADRIAVMYAGKLVEVASREEIFAEPLHPYTNGLLRSAPNFLRKERKLAYIPGEPPDLINPPAGCLFNPRCSRRFDKCLSRHPSLIDVGGRLVACYLYGG